MDDRCSNGRTMEKKFQELGQYFKDTMYVFAYISFLIIFISKTFLVETFGLI